MNFETFTTVKMACGVAASIGLYSMLFRENKLYRFFENGYPSIFDDIRTKKALDDGLRKKMTDAIKEFKTRFVAEQPVAAHA